MFKSLLAIIGIEFIYIIHEETHYFFRQKKKKKHESQYR